MADSVPGGTSNVPGGALRLADDLVISRMGFGAMQLAGPGVFGPPRDRDQALAVLREAVESGITHIDTSDFYGPVVVNELIREALYPYPADLRIVTKVGARRGADGSWRPSLEPADLVAQVRENLAHLGVDALDVVNLRLSAHGTGREPVAEPFGALAELQKAGLIRHLGLSEASDAQLTEAQAIAPVVTVQNLYNVASRRDDALVDRCAAEGIAYAAYFPLGGFTPLASRRWKAWPPALARPRTRSPWPGCCSAHPRWSSSPAPRPWPTCARTSPPPTCCCRPTRSPNSTPSAANRPRSWENRRVVPPTSMTCSWRPRAWRAR